MAKKKKGNIALKIVSSVLCVLLVLVMLALIAFSAGENIVFADFYSRADKEFKIPGLWTGSVPQGFEYMEEIELFMYTGYQKDEVSPSVVYLMPEDGEGEARKVELFNKDGSNYTEHVGGITVYEGYVYICATKNSLDIFELSDVLDSDNKATKIDTLEVGFDVAFCEVRGDKLYAGNFYRAVDYETPENHHITTPTGDKNTAVIYQYSLDFETGYVKSTHPEKVYSITDAIQGMTFTDDGRIILSTSWGLTKSHIYVYDESLADTAEFDYNGKKLPLTYLDSKCLVQDIVAPPMAEEIVYDDGDVYILTEAASMKYLFGKITGASWCYAYELDD